jgi:hypothetical protein
MNFFCEEAFAADFCKPAILDKVPRSCDSMFLKSLSGTQHGTDICNASKKRARLDERQRAAARADTKGKRAGVRPHTPPTMRKFRDDTR